MQEIEQTAISIFLSIFDRPENNPDGTFWDTLHKSMKYIFFQNKPGTL